MFLENLMTQVVFSYKFKNGDETEDFDTMEELKEYLENNYSEEEIEDGFYIRKFI